MNFIVFGCGSIGRRHIKNLQTLGHEVIGIDVSDENRKWVEENLKIRTFSDVTETLSTNTFSGALICTPPNSHLALAEVALKAGLNVFIEKPLSHNLIGLSNLIKLAKKKNLIVAVGYNLRFNLGIKKIKELISNNVIGKPLYSRIFAGQYLPDWRPWQNYKNSYTSKKSMGGGIILDGSHEFDYARWLFGEVSSVTCLSRKLSSLEVETEDSADILLDFSSGHVSNIHIDFIRRDQARNCEIIGETGTIKLTFWDKIEIYTAADKKTEIIDIREDTNNMYVAEMKSFIDNIKNKSMPLVNLSEGEKTLKVALVAKSSSEKNKTIKIKI